MRTSAMIASRTLKPLPFRPVRSRVSMLAPASPATRHRGCPGAVGSSPGSIRSQDRPSSGIRSVRSGRRRLVRPPSRDIRDPAVPARHRPPPTATPRPQPARMPRAQHRGRADRTDRAGSCTATCAAPVSQRPSALSARHDRRRRRSQQQPRRAANAPAAGRQQGDNRRQRQQSQRAQRGQHRGPDPLAPRRSRAAAPGQ